MGEEKGKIQVRAMTAIGWRDLRGIWAGPSMIEGTKRKYAFREGEYVDAHVMACVRDQR